MRIRNLMSALVIAVALIASSCTGGKSDSADPKRSGRDNGQAQAGQLKWTTCDNELARAAKLECSNLSVPLDPETPDGESIDLMLARQKATGEPEERIGSLVMNPGGPGGSGIEFLAGVSLALPDDLKNRFDLVSFDPRGVGESTPVHCLPDSEKAKQLEGNQTPDSEADIDNALKDQKQMLKACEKNSGELIAHMSTADVASDLDLIRDALGDEKLTYMGFSYGTAIGAVYATLFPENTRALALDGSVNPVESPSEETLTQALAFEQVLGEFETACDASRACALAPDSKSAIEDARSRLETSPIKVETDFGKRTMGVDQFDLALATGLYDSSLWGVLADSISDLKTGGAPTLFLLMDRQTGRRADGSFDNSADARAMVNCADAAQRPDKQEAVELAEKVAEAAPTFGPALGWSSLGCINWPEAANPLPKITGAGSAPILVIGTKGDPATPYAWSQAMTSALESAELLTYEGSGHTAFMKGGPCIDDAVVNYLVDLKLPDPGTSCAAAKNAVSFEGLAEQVVSQMVMVGLPEDVAECIVNAAITDVGEAEFDRMVIGQDTEGLGRLISAKTLSCMRVKGDK